jgi:hypothetical protein
MTSSASPPQPGQDGVSLGSGVDLKRLNEELIWLRSREGLVYDRVKDCNELISIARSWKKSQASANPGLDDVFTAMEMVAQALESERPIEYRDCLKITYGLIDSAHGLSRDERMRKYLELPRDQQTVYSGQSIERYSKTMAAQLATKLASIAVFHSVPANAEFANVHPSDTEAPSRPYSMDSVKARYRMADGHFLRDMLFERTITCLAPGSHVYLVRHIHYSDLREGVHRVEPIYGCELVRDYYENGVYFATLQLSKTLEVDETFEFIYRVRVNAEKPFGHFVFMTPSANVGRLEIGVQFETDAVPGSFWTFSGGNYLEVLDQNARRQVLHSHDGSRHITESWDNLHRGLSYGIDWGSVSPA